MKIEELFANEAVSRPNQLQANVRVSPIKSPTRQSKENVQKPVRHDASGSKLVKRNNTPVNMKCEQLNKHEEMSYMEDAEANEAILKNTVSKDELCRFLTPLKFMEIETWRKEVPCGENIDDAEVEHRKWRTPIEILLPIAGRDDDLSNSSQDDHKDNSTKKKPVSAYGNRRKFFEDVQKQNAEVLHRSKSDAAKIELPQPRVREVYSAGEKTNFRPQQSPRQLNGNRSLAAAEYRLRTAYGPAPGIPPTKDTHGPKNSGQIYVNRSVTGGGQITDDALPTSYFAPGRQVLPRSRGRLTTEPIRMNSADGGGPSPRNISQMTRKISQFSNFGSSSPSGHRISSNSTPGRINESNHRQPTGVHEDIQVLPFNTLRPQTVGENIMRHDSYQKHPKFRGAHRNTARGWRNWNSRGRTIENSFGAATKLYQNSVLQKRTPTVRTLGKLRAHRQGNVIRDSCPKSNQSSEATFQQNNGDNDKAIQNQVTKISYAVRRPKDFRVRTHATEDRNTMSIVAPVPPIEMKLPTADNLQNNETHNISNESMNSNSRNGLKYLNADGLIELCPLQNGTMTSPWVAEAFSPALASPDGYYASHQRQNKTVTFRLGAA